MGRLILSVARVAELAAATVLALELQGMLDREDLISMHLEDRPWFDKAGK